MLRKRIIVLMLAGCMAFGLTACGGESDEKTAGMAEETVTGDPSEMKLKEQLDIAIISENAVYDLHKSSSTGSRTALCGTVFEQIVTLNGKSEPVPELCESYEVNDTATEYTFKLREGVLFHDGTEMTSADAVASLNRWIDSYSAVRDLVGEERFEAVDEYTIKISTESPCVTLLYLMAGGSQRAVITTEKCTKNEDSDGNMQEIIGTGPYKFAEWKLDQYTMLERFDDYVPYGDPEAEPDGWAGYKHAYSDRICLWVVPDEATRIAGLQTGQYDSINVSDSMVPTIETNENVQIYTEEGGQVAIVFNKQQGLCSDLNMRKAINAIVNCDELMIVSYGGSYTLNSCYMEENQELWNTDAGSDNYNTQDMDAAKEYMNAAGYSGETLKILASSDNNFDKIAIVLEQQLENQGIDCELTTVDWGTFSEYRNDPDRYDLYISSFSSVPVPRLRLYFGSNYAGWTNDAELTKLWEPYNQALSLDEAADAWKAVQEYCWDYLPIINLGHYQSINAMNADMQGVIYQSSGYYWNAYVPE